MKTLDELNKEWGGLKVKTEEYLATVELYFKAVDHAYLAQKYGVSIDPEKMSKLELVDWYKKCLTYDE